MDRKDLATAVHLASATISSAIFLATGALLFAACLNASVGGRAVGEDNEIRAMVFGFITLINAVLFTIWGLVGMRKAIRGYKALGR
ncbi:hypothetical protein [Tautonia marina]|uniref:hypothetical protein n=1 Tax=Tautonia marina TaxID=2653855 RepID=UPI001260C6F7|nr:hypothetical protein [Tautonia marina]